MSSLLHHCHSTLTATLLFCHDFIPLRVSTSSWLNWQLNFELISQCSYNKHFCGKQSKAYHNHYYYHYYHYCIRLRRQPQLQLCVSRRLFPEARPVSLIIAASTQLLLNEETAVTAVPAAAAWLLSEGRRCRLTVAPCARWWFPISEWVGGISVQADT